LTTEGKSNEISAVPKLPDMPEITGDIVTADAMSCRTEIARKIREKGADYILALKENQKTLYHNTKDYFEGTGSGEIDELPEDLWQGEEEKGHGRKERREVRTVTDIEWPGNKAAWQDVKTLIQYRTFRTVGGKGTVQTDRYYISSWDFGAEEFLKYIRGYRLVENQPHSGCRI
jgi:predicted transposase YbfD/YdcC